MTMSLFRTLAVAYTVPFDFHAVVAKGLSPGLSPGHGLLARAIDALREANQRKAACEVARFIERNGGQLTDDLEREISQRFGSPVERGAV
jgi:hypothetical protein